MEASTQNDGDGDGGDGGVRCPTCRAEQKWSDTCRRCKCDLTLLRSVAEACRRDRHRCLLLLRAGRPAEALTKARRLYALDPNQQSARLLAVCHLLSGNWTKALALARVARTETE